MARREKQGRFIAEGEPARAQMPKQNLSVELTFAEWDALRQLARAADRSKGAEIRRLIMQEARRCGLLSVCQPGESEVAPSSSSITPTIAM